MNVKQLITIKEDLGDSISSYARVIESPKAITLADSALLSYIFSVDVTSDCIEIDIELIDDVKIQCAHDMLVPFQFIQKIAGEYHIYQHNISIDDINPDYIASIMAKPVEMAHQSFSTFVDKEQTSVDGLSIVYDQTKANEYKYQVKDELKACIDEHFLGDDFIIFRKFIVKNQDERFFVQLVFFPKTRQIIEYTTKHTFDLEKKNLIHRHVTIDYFEQGKLKNSVKEHRVMDNDTFF